MPMIGYCKSGAAHCSVPPCTSKAMLGTPPSAADRSAAGGVLADLQTLHVSLSCLSRSERGACELEESCWPGAAHAPTHAV